MWALAAAILIVLFTLVFAAEWLEHRRHIRWRDEQVRRRLAEAAHEAAAEERRW